MDDVWGDFYGRHTAQHKLQWSYVKTGNCEIQSALNCAIV